MAKDGGASKEARRAREAEDARERRIKMGTSDIRTRFGGAFDDKYYAGLEKDVKDFYTPQLQSQYEKGRMQLKYALARSGMLGASDVLGDSPVRASSIQTRREAEMAKQMALAGQTIEQRAIGMSNQRRQDVANAEQVALQQLHASADPAAAAAQAQNLIEINSKNPEFSPLGQVFTDFTAGLATQGDLEREGRNRYDFGVSNWFPGTRRGYKNVG